MEQKLVIYNRYTKENIKIKAQKGFIAVCLIDIHEKSDNIAV